MLDSPDSVLVMLSPDDSVDSAIAKVRQAEAPQITLLVPDGTRALQSMGACDKLRQGAQQAGKTVTIYSSDEKTCNAAQLCKLAVVRIDASMPTGGTPARNPAPTGRPGAQAKPRNPAAFDDDFLASLERVPEETPSPPSTQPRTFQSLERTEPSPTLFADPLDDEWAAALNDFSRTAIGEQNARSGAPTDAEWASAFDDLSDTFAADAGFGGETAEARPRFRAEDMELTDEDLRRQIPQKDRRKQERKPSRLAGIFGAVSALGRRRPAQGEGLDGDELELEPAPMPMIPRPERSEQEQVERDRQRRNFTLIPIAALAVLSIIAALLWFSGQGGAEATVSVSPPPAESGRVIPNVSLPISAINGIPLQITVSVERNGQVAGETLAPVSQARGRVMIANRLFEDVVLEKGKAAIGTNPEGVPVRFLLEETVTVPASQETFAGMTFGTVEVDVVAASGGAAYNIPGETRLEIEGYEGALNAISQGSIEGGEDQVQRIVTLQDAEALLGEALPLLARQANTELRTKAEEQGAGLGNAALIPVTPTLDVLKTTPDAYRIETIPPIGSVSESGEFKLIVSGDFSTIAIRKGTEVDGLLQEEVTKQLGMLGQADPNTEIITVQDVVLEGERLVATAKVTPQGGVLQDAFLREIAQLIGGKSKKDATAHLERLKRQGRIGSYVLPEADPLPAAEELAVTERKEVKLTPTPEDTP